MDMMICSSYFVSWMSFVYGNNRCRQFCMAIVVVVVLTWTALVYHRYQGMTLYLRHGWKID